MVGLTPELFIIMKKLDTLIDDYSFFLNQVVRLDGIKVEAVPQLEKLVRAYTNDFTHGHLNNNPFTFKFCLKSLRVYTWGLG